MKMWKTLLLTISLLLSVGAQTWGLSTDQPAEAGADIGSAVFAGGCFWCTEADFEKVPGVIDAVSGYTGGKEVNPTYEQVSAHETGHVEAVKVIYDPARVSYDQLVEWFWRHVDPTDAHGQFVDRGPQYRSVIFTADHEQQQIATASKQKLTASRRFSGAIKTEILPLGPFYPAEDYHQNYYRENLMRYKWYRSGSGRDPFLEKYWSEDELQFASIKAEAPASGKGTKSSIPVDRLGPQEQPLQQARRYQIPDDAELRLKLSSIQYEVIRENGTEPAFDNSYWNNHAAGIYVDIISGEPLFSSLDKYESGSGWPSFTRPLAPENIVEKVDKSFFMTRTEVRSKYADSHLGHVFDDGPAPTGLRYCMNSAALRFVPLAELEREGYAEYLPLFK